MKNLTKFFLLLAMLPGLCSAAAASDSLPLKATWALYSLQPEQRQAAGVNAPLVAVLHVETEKGWYIYSDRKTPVGKPSRLTATLGDGPDLTVLYPAGKEKQDTVDPSILVETYEKPVNLFVPLPQDTAAPLSLQARLSVLLCSATSCVPASLDTPATLHDVGPMPAELAAMLAEAARRNAQAQSPQAPPDAPGPAAATQAPPQDLNPEQEAPAPQAAASDWSFAPQVFAPHLETTSLLTALFLGLLAGLVLNFMPCVLPVISLKLSAIMAGAGCRESLPCERLFREHNIFFALGILLYFLILSLVLGFTGLAWGQFFQQPGVVVVLVTLVYALGLSLTGLYTLPIVDMKFGRAARPRTQAFLTGMLTTLLATPCSGPFLGGVLSWAMLQPAAIISTVFLSIGVGMAAPYLLMAFLPGLMRLLPKPGPWINSLERLVAFFLMGTCIYLLNILPQEMVIPALAGLWITTIACWFWGKADRVSGRANALVLRLAAAAVIAAALFVALRPFEKSAWEDFDPQVFNERLGKANMFVEFTADWCPSCKVLNKAVLTPGNLTAWQEKFGLTFIRVDLTQPNPEGERLLQALGSRSIPLVAVFPASDPGHPLILRDFYTPSQVRSALSRTIRSQ